MKLDLTNTKTRTYNAEKFKKLLKIGEEENIIYIDYNTNLEPPNTITIKTESEETKC